MSIQKAEMTVEQKENGQYVEQVVYPFVEYDHVAMENGMDIMSMIRDDVSTPMVTHNTTSWKVGQGDSDVSETIVDSSVANMTIKGQTYQNILPNPSLRNSMTNGKTIQKLNEGYESVNTVDGVCKSAILSGQTLVNLLGNYPEQTFTLDNTWQQRNIPIEYTNLIKPNTTYTFVFNVTECQMTDSTKSNLQIGDDHVFNNMVNLNLKLGVNTYKLTTKDSITFPLKLYGSAYNSGTLTFNLMLLEGDYVGQNIPHFNGMQSVKMPVLTTSNFLKVLGNEEIVNIYNSMGYSNVHAKLSENGKFILTGNGGWISPNKVWRLEPNTTYTARIQGEVSFGTFYSNAISNIHRDSFDGGIYVKFTTDDTGDFGFLLTFTTGVEVDFNIFYGDVTSKLTEPYKSNILSTPEEVALRGIGDVQDTLNLMTGELTQRIGELVITDNTPSKIVRVTDNGMVQVNIPISVFNTGNGTTSKDNIRCDKFTWSEANILNPQEGLRVNGNTLHWAVSISKLSSTDLIGVNNYLSNNPITVQYQLATEKSIKTVDLSILDQDNQPITQLNSFANGYIQVSSQEGTLIPTTEYEVPTSNSYHVELMKANTQYTMKNMQGAFTIDGIQYNASANGTFTSPSTLSNRLMITNVVQTQPMLLEGDMTSKEVPYVEGIKSTFEGVDKVEVYSVGKNLFDVNKIDKSNPLITKIDSSSIQLSGSGRFDAVAVNLELEPNTTYTLGYNYNLEKGSFSPATMRTSQIEGATISNIRIFFDANTNNTEKSVQFTTTSTGKVMIRLYGCNDAQEYVTTFSNIYINKGVSVGFSPHKSNTTSFPITNPLRSLPNGVRDEIVLDRVNHKTKIIQRVGEDLTQLDTPIVTEVNLEGYPYVYKGGHIFLNTEIAPITEVTYSINQAHQIESSNEDILRHQKEINHLYELIAQYVQVQYEAELIDIALQG